MLLKKGHLHHRQEGRAFVYEPNAATPKAAQSAVKRLPDVFFQGSLERAVSGLLDARQSTNKEELTRLETLIREARNVSCLPCKLPKSYHLQRGQSMGANHGKMPIPA